MNYYIADVQWRSKRGGDGGGKIEGIAKKNWEGEKHLGGEILGRAFR